MPMYFRVVLDKSSESYSVSEEQQLRECITSIPGMAGITKIERNVKGGYSVIINQEGTVDEVITHLLSAGYRLVL